MAKAPIPKSRCSRTFRENSMTSDSELKQMFKEMTIDLKESYRKDLQILESNLTNAQLRAVQEAKDLVVAVEKRQDKVEITCHDHDSKINKLFSIVDEIRDGYQQAVGAFKLWGLVCGVATVVSAFTALYVAFK